MGNYAKAGLIGGWLPSCVTLLIVRWTMLPFHVDRVTLNFLAFLFIVGGTLLCMFAGHLFDKHESAKAEIQRLKDRVDNLEG